MKKLLTVCILLGTMLFLVSPVFGQHVWKVNDKGQITMDGTVFRIKGGSWFGLEGRYEIPTDANNPAGAPMELYMGNVFWATSNRTYDSDATEIKGMGFNTIRLPVVHQGLDNNDPQGKDPVLKNTSSVRIQGGLNAIKQVMSSCNKAGLMVMLDIHSCSNYVGWRKGRLDARPPWADANRNDYQYKREDCSCASTNNPSTVTRVQAYNESLWKQDLTALAKMDQTCSTNCLIGIDIYNEPWDYSWAEWSKMIDTAYTTINAANSNILIFAQGIGGSSGHQDGTPDTTTDSPHGTINPNWGENLYEAGKNPPAVCPKNKLVYSPHTYGPSVCTQGFFADTTAQPSCATLQEDAFGDAQCQIVIDAAKLEKGWEEHFGYLKDLGYAIAVGEWGGNMDWPAKAETRMQTRYKYLTNKQSDLQWQTAFANYLIKRGICDNFYWSINPESSDTYGVYTTPYDPVSNTGGWGTWQSADTRKTSMLKKIWDATFIPPATPTNTTIGPTPTPTPTPTGTCNRSGDANSNGITDINDALLVARYSAGISVTISTTNSDMNCDNAITINDALLIARKTAGF